MNILKKKQKGAIENILAKGVQSKNRKTTLLSGLQSTLTGLKEEEQVLQEVRYELKSIVENLQNEDKLFEQELSSISTVRSNIEKLLGETV